MKLENIPKIGLGTYQMTGEKCTNAVVEAIDIGYRLIDTAQLYRNEEDIGVALQKSSVPREELILASKVWVTNLSPKRVISSTEKSLQKLKTDYLDIMYIHWPAVRYNVKKTIGAFQQLLDEGKIKAFGVSNFTPKLIDDIEKFNSIRIWGNQVEHHLLLQQKPMRSYLEKQNMKMVAYSPLARGKVLSLPIIQELAQKYEKSPSQIALAWIMAHNVIPIPKASSKNHLKQNFKAQEIVLTEEDMIKLDNLQIQKRLFSPPILSPKW
ncbi:hypothetical protein NEF87_001114 [Candidatus Lokiarchaeum ossiferum]|uniref:NADP-dependent oxidoreductase domain-containing protein n=1 Tax=Candidatus Lokiarchaeum ossiferum TaxID=2951803 RepID=A0ABY6HMU3_9ARCH|nr:hypothetical protein NEF87_001114 [Candidatus Lokiarchaeum sp. B-35]